MSGYYISIQIKSSSAAVRRTLTVLFASYGFQPIGDEAAQKVVDDEDALPNGDDWYGVLVSGDAHAGWTSVYVADWQDSGVLAKGLSSDLETPALEIWVAEDTHWGYTYYENGTVKDRFADDPSKVGETAAEVNALHGQSDALAAILCVPSPLLDQTLTDARASAGEFVGTAIDAFGKAAGVPFDHIMIGYEAFFEDDPDDYASGLDHWPQWHHLAFRHPQSKEQLAE